MRSRIVVTVVMPGLIGYGVCFFLSGLGPAMWILASPLLLLLLFMASLAEIHEFGSGVSVRTLFGTHHVAKKDILSVGNSVLEDIGVIRARRYIFPWGAIYFVRQWSALPLERRQPVIDGLSMVVMGCSGFIVSRAAHISRFQIRTGGGVKLAILCAVLLCIFALTIYKREPGVANWIMFAAGFILGVTHY
jgi:hypothetical protein